MTRSVTSPDRLDQAAGSDRPLLRVLAGGAAATALVTLALVGVLGVEGGLLPTLWAVVAAGAGGTALTWLRDRGAPPSWWTSALLGAVAGVVAAVALYGGYALVAVLVTGPVGVVGGVAAAAVARLTPGRAVPVVLLAGVVGTGAALVAAHQGQQPPYPGSYLVVTDPAGAGPALPVAERAAAELRTAEDPLDDATWGAVGGGLVDVRPGRSVSLGYGSAPGERRITVDVEGDLACVLVTARSVEARPGACPRPQPSA